MTNLPPHVILGANSNAVEGGIRLWQDTDELKGLGDAGTWTLSQTASKLVVRALAK